MSRHCRHGVAADACGDALCTAEETIKFLRRRVRGLQESASELLAALKAARDHLNYCGYGDQWERECAQAENLPEKIEAAIAKAEGKEQGE